VKYSILRIRERIAKERKRKEKKKIGDPTISQTLTGRILILASVLIF
jgi:hypothetical protein